jgi:D-alanine-D-alanine ligase-like ATP-grasp enzyme
MQKRVGILRGGIGENYHTSIRKGGEILSHITEYLSDSWKTFDILIDKEGVWHINGVPVQPADLMHRVDLVWNTAEPQISATLHNLSISHIGQNLFHSTIEESKEMLRKHMQKIGLDMPRSLVIPLYQEDFDGPRELYAIKKAKEVHEKFPAPWIVKSFTEDKNMGIHLAKTFPELVDAIEDGVKHEKSILAEEFITGKIASVHAVPHFRNEEIYIFPLGNTFGTFSAEEKAELINIAKKLYSHLGAEHYLKSDFVLSPRGKVYLLQAESIPDLKPDSHFSEACMHAGTRAHLIVDHILQNAL